MTKHQLSTNCQLVRTDSTTVAGNARGYKITPLGQERRLHRLTLKVQKRQYLHNLKKTFNIAHKSAATCLTLLHTPLTSDITTLIAQKIKNI